jgi:hypothetical protein
VRLRARLHWWHLDAELAAGAGTTTPELRRRAAWLTSPRVRWRLADCLEGAVDAAHRPHPRLSPQVPVNAGAILDAEGVVHGLASLLREHDGSARAVAIVSMLLHDGHGPLYDQRYADLLEHDLRYARDLLREGTQ